MKVQFKDNSYVELKNSNEPGKILLTVQAKDQANSLKTITHCVELTLEQFKVLISDIN